jgi:hypothetical protein
MGWLGGPGHAGVVSNPAGQRKPPSEGLISNGGSSRGEGTHGDTALMRERCGGTLPLVATNCLPGTDSKKPRGVPPVERTIPETFSL